MQTPQLATITSGWQVYIPEKIREEIGLDKPVQVEITTKKKSIVIKPKKSGLLAMAGKYRHLTKKVKIDLSRIRDYIDYGNL
jgi:bifunctional DNA-binding transcriptional regulator/antitoxin component of YhaV-PrlF toxin-antitoxin module